MSFAFDSAEAEAALLARTQELEAAEREVARLRAALEQIVTRDYERNCGRCKTCIASAALEPTTAKAAREAIRVGGGE